MLYKAFIPTSKSCSQIGWFDHHRGFSKIVSSTLLVGKYENADHSIDSSCSYLANEITAVSPAFSASNKHIV